jgi:hypothetical protein
MAAMQKAISDCEAAGVWPLNPEVLIEVDFEIDQQANDVDLQITKHENNQLE